MAHNVRSAVSTHRRAVAATLATAAAVLYLADLTGLKPPPRILPSVLLAVAAVAVGVQPRPAPVTVTRGDRVMAGVGLALQGALFVPILPIGLVAPGAGVIVVHGTWLAGTITAWRLRRTNPRVVLALPFLTAAALTGIVWFGTTQLGWRP